MTNPLRRILSVLNLVNAYDNTPLYKGALLKKYDEMFNNYSIGVDSPEVVIAKLQHSLSEAKAFEALSVWADHKKDMHLNLRLRPTKKIRFSLYYLPPHTSHPPHAHHRLTSIQTLVSGKLHLREYENVFSNEEEIHVKQVTEKNLSLYESFITAPTYRNVHWFGTFDEPAYILSYSVTEGILGKYNLTGRSVNGRFCVDPTVNSADPNGIIRAPLIPYEEAVRQFSNSIFQHSMVA